MPVMAEPPKKKRPKGRPVDLDRHQGAQTPFRAVDAQLLVALQAYAKSVRRSRNMAMNILLEEILQAKGFWPWPPPPRDEA